MHMWHMRSSAGAAHVSAIESVVAYCCSSYFILQLWVCVPAFVCVKRNESCVAALPQMFTTLYVSVCVCFASGSCFITGRWNPVCVCGVGRKLGIAVLHGLRADSLTAVFHGIVLKQDYCRWGLRARCDHPFAVTAAT